ncbi:PTS sugar transporter subunit IIA [Mycoplasma crocodyli]|uniref:PTS system, N-acetylgalactosamine-specific, IIA component n=1 Tax=Mycoplasma crocodyli (strain ATCC 51981 / MP145) TaxID=512564 RepID=D5E5I6_MYCCM|nr:PTS fructose transporter subunit IIA [Mycoplasma crocodyli]ADE19527.1 PTS system, N-acetylgalactosamine-specific, IIA component [Mycoplasma crocodyli MP145]
MKVDFIIVGHAKYPEGIKSVLEFVVGIEENVYTYNIDENNEINSLKTKLETHFNNDNAKVIIADIPGGSPHQKAMELAMNNKKQQVIVFGGLSTSAIIDTSIKALLLSPSDFETLKNNCKANFDNIASFTTYYSN